jgi:SAM-dependent methyltransferase
VDPKSFWDIRYASVGYSYGVLPNVFLKEQLHLLPFGKILFLGEGEGRNAVYAAQHGWVVSAVDLSEEGRNKALNLASEKSVSIDYLVGDASTVEFEENSFDAIALIYAHFPESIRKIIHRKAIAWLKPGGKIILEAFRPEQLHFKSGGPKEVSMLFTKALLENDFDDLTIYQLDTLNTILNEGDFHQGEAAIIRLVAIK